ncbi:MFS transporter, MHS family, proline/betaine transporter [Friedmanniella luteola]|uniref:MFS transporter, MHS family, proline/betaine transporter n=1 Tax=Friedmanniella luteola TaxID=546871 RepID=A0A1H1XM95_9ACTN|nr:MFS transporter [Friedmanniella luteola]SDT10320.1 MFS transporter, MHS family, proline/betaine transporter [Friedmanniella luteola]
MAIVREPVEARSTVRRAVAAACIGNAAEWYDYAVYGALATVIGAVFFPAADAATALSAAFAVYGTALVLRPVGAVVFGRLGDTRGRRSVLVVVILLMTGATAGVGLLPGYASIGLAAPVLLVLLRAAQGVAVGGEVGAAVVFILESAPSSRRGRTASWHTATMALGIGTGMGAAGLLSGLVGDAGSWPSWWRIAFLLALPLGLTGLYLRRRVPETDPFARLQATSRRLDHPIRELWRRHRPAMRRGFCLVAAGSAAFNTFFIFVPNHLVVEHGAALTRTLLGTAATLAVAAGAALALGGLSDRVGRRPVVLGCCAALVVLAVPAIVIATRGSLPGVMAAQLLVGLPVVGILAVAMLGEAFPAPVRSTGVAVTAGVATALVGGTAPWLAQVLVRTTAGETAPGLYVAVIGVVALGAVRRWPETAFRGLP